MKKEESVIKYYLLAAKLNDLIRKGWLDWGVNRDRRESDSEHVYSTIQLAIFMHSQFHYNVDLSKVVMMLAIHEMGETIIGDLTQFQISREEKMKIEHEAIHNIFAGLDEGEFLENLFLEFDAHETPESIFAYQCDKLQCDITAKIYGQENCVDMTKQENNNTYHNAKVQELLKKNNGVWEDMWIEFGQLTYPYDENFMAISKYIKENKIEETLSEFFTSDSIKKVIER